MKVVYSHYQLFLPSFCDDSKELCPIVKDDPFTNIVVVISKIAVVVLEVEDASIVAAEVFLTIVVEDTCVVPDNVIDISSFQMISRS